MLIFNLINVLVQEKYIGIYIYSCLTDIIKYMNLGIKFSM